MADVRLILCRAASCAVAALIVGILLAAHATAEDNQAPPAVITEVEDEPTTDGDPTGPANPSESPSQHNAGSSAAETLPLPAPAPRPLAREAKPVPVPPPLNLRPDPTNVLDEVRLLAAAKRYTEALDLLRTYRRSNPEDEQSRRLELAIEVDRNEHRMRALIGDQRNERLVVLADPDYLTAKAAASRPVVRRLDVVEFLVAQKRYPEALSAANAILEDHPYDEAVMTLKNAILSTMVEIERRKALRDRDVRHSEVIKEVIEDSTMPRRPQAIPRTVLVFDEDLADIERQRVQERLNITLDNISYENAPVGEVLKLLFAAVGMNYIILDEAISTQTITMFLVDSSVAEVLGVLQNMVDIRFNYRGGTVYVTNSETPILVTEIIRLAAGLTNVMAQPALEAMTGGGGDGGGGGQANVFGGGGGGEGEGGASDLERFLERIPELVDWPNGSTYFVERKSNTLYVRSSPSTVAEIKRLLHALDFNSVQILIEAKFVEVSEDAFRELGVDWKIGGFRTSGSDGVVAGGVQSGGTAAADLFTNLGVLSNPALALAAAGLMEQGVNANAVSPNGSGLSVGLVGGGNGMNPNFEVRLRALEGKGKANTLSEPKILTLSNSTGLIDISQDISYVEDIENRGVTGSITDANGNVIQNNVNLPVPRFATESEGIRLRVVPSVARNSDIITMAIFPTVRELTGFREQVVVNSQAPGTNNSVQRPEFATRSLATALHVKNGETVVLGGLIKEFTQEGRRGIPFLSSIPIAGSLFRTDTKTNERRKLLIFVTARIIDPSGAEVGEEEQWLRDTARVVLPPAVQQQLREQDRERQEEAEAALQEWQDKASGRRQRSSDDEDDVRAGNPRSRLQGRP